MLVDNRDLGDYMSAENAKKMATYQYLEGNGYLTLRLFGECEGSSVTSAEITFAQMTDGKPLHLIVNCESLSFLSIEWIRFILRIQQQLKISELSVRLIKLQPSLSQKFKKDGLDKAFKCFKDLRSALIDIGLVSEKRLDTDFINPFLTSTINVLKMLARVEALPGKPYLKKTGKKFIGDISGVIGIVSETFSGSVIISFPAETFLAVMSSMLGEHYTEVNDEIIDGAGEITNQVFGQSKVILNEKGYGIKSAIPPVVSGKDHTLTSLNTGPTVVLPFQSDCGEFFVEISISE